ncbi:transcription factor bHLH143-like [Punica granatum]|uniref:Uncharacterized protein n=2 Tax=Punica granatum TaxID=22663 RepID=A0A2I0K487_PUNGR|nr:transcription factor bHLH143-like [Punica granatum]PKI63371.1 hypothetical protein CRG98_016259 [Punica granatum]
MVKAGDSWVFEYPPTWKPPDLNGKGASLQPKKQGLMTSYVNPGSPFSPSLVKLPGFAVSGIPNLNIHHTGAPAGSIHCLPSHLQAVPPTLDPVKENASLVSHESGGNNPTLSSFGKRYLVFDQSEKGTRLIYGPSSPLFQKSEVLRRKPYGNLPLDKGEQPTNLTRFGLVNPIFQEESGENYVSGEESEMHEDTEEINALLYSDDDDDYDEENGDEEDEVTSTGHTPSLLVQCCGKRDEVGHTLDEVGSAGRLNKRQKVIGGEYNCSNLLTTGTPPLKLGTSNENESDADSSCIRSQAKGEEKVPVFGGELSKKDEIRQTMKILEGIVPSAEGKDPVVILDEAIKYLKTMKLKAKVLGMSFH